MGGRGRGVRRWVVDGEERRFRLTGSYNPFRSKCLTGLTLH